MIEPLEPSSEAKQTFVVADIETMPNGDVFYIGTSYRFNGEVKHEKHTNWSDWFDRILQLSSFDKKYRTIYAHNGGGFDWLSLLEMLLKNERFRFWKIEGQRVQSKIVVLRVHVERIDNRKKCRENPDGKVSRFCLRFADSLYLLRSKLDTLAVKFLGAGKTDLGGKLPHEIYANNPALFFTYLERDCNSLLLILEKVLVTIREKISKIDSLGLTIGSTAMKIWRTTYLNRTITVPSDNKVKELLRDAYKGGRVEVFQYGEFPKLNVYDINSLYPTAMVRAKVPCSDRGDFTSIFRWKLPGVYRVKFRQYRDDVPPVLMLQGSGAYEGEGSFFTPELELLKEIDPHCELKLLDGYTFFESDYLFSDYVNTLYPIRQTDKDGPLDLLVKYCLNSLYGKLAQKPEREQYIVFSDIREATQAIKDGRKLIEINLELGAWQEKTESEVSFEHVGIAGMVTSVSRTILYRGLLAAGVERLVYCDTDSVHTTGELSNDLIGPDLGKFKLEFSGSGVYAGRKLYGLRSNAGKEKIRAKGVSVGGSNGCRLDYDSMLRIVAGESIPCTFYQPTTANEVMSGQKACVFRKRKRTLRMVRR